MSTLTAFTAAYLSFYPLPTSEKPLPPPSVVRGAILASAPLAALSVPVPAAPAPAPPATPCEAAIARNSYPLPAGVVEHCSGSPVYHWGATDGTTIWYTPSKIQKQSGDQAWDYVVAHERSHAERYVTGHRNWANEPAADRGAERHYPDLTNRWTPYR